FCRGWSGSFTSRQDEVLRKTEEPMAVLLRPRPRGLVVPIGPHLTSFLDLTIVDVRDNRCVVADPSHMDISRFQIRISSPRHSRDGRRFAVASAARRVVVGVEEVVGQQFFGYFPIPLASGLPELFLQREKSCLELLFFVIC